MARTRPRLTLLETALVLSLGGVVLAVFVHEVDFWAPETLGHETWRALELRAGRPIRYSYEYAPSRSGCGISKSETPVLIVFRARGDLDGDGVLSTFERHATVGPDGFTEADVLLVHQRTE